MLCCDALSAFGPRYIIAQILFLISVFAAAFQNHTIPYLIQQTFLGCLMLTICLYGSMFCRFVSGSR